MHSTYVEITTPEGIANAYLSRPDEHGHPGVLFLMDAFGLRPTIEEMADRIAAEGYIVLAPNLFYRAGPSPVPALPDMSGEQERAEFFRSLRPLMNALTPERIAADADAYLDTLAGAGAEGPVAITGYCMGGRVGWRVAAARPDRVSALAGFHVGGLVTDEPDSPHLSAGRIRAEVYFGFADEDPSMNREQIATLERALEEAGAHYTAEVYEGAKHGYTMADTPVYDEAARERHFRELRDLLERASGAGAMRSS